MQTKSFNSIEEAAASSKFSDQPVVSKEVPVKIDHTYGFGADYLRTYAGYNANDIANYQTAYQLTKELSVESGLNKLMLNFVSLFGDSIEERSVDNRNQNLVVYHFATTMVVLFLGLAFYSNTIKGIAHKLNHNKAFRAFINALLPNSLPPHAKYNPSSLYRISEMFSRLAAEDKEPGDKQELYEFWRNLRIKEAITANDRNTYVGTHGFLEGETLVSDQSFSDTLGADGQYMNATYMEEDGSPSKHYVSCSIFNCSKRMLVDLILMCKKNNEKAAFHQIFDSLKHIEKCVFMSDALNTSQELINHARSIGLDYLMPVKRNVENKKVNMLAKTMFECASSANCLTYKRFESNAHVNGNRYEKVIVETISISELEQLKNTFPKEFADVNLQAFEGYTGLVTIVKKTKFTQVISAKYSPGTLEKLNINSNKGEVHYYISSIDNDEHGFMQILISLNEYWLCEQAHNTADTVLDQDLIASSNASNNLMRVNFSRLIVDMLNLYRSKYNSQVERKSHALTYDECRELLADDLCSRVECLTMLLSRIFPNVI